MYREIYQNKFFMINFFLILKDFSIIGIRSLNPACIIFNEYSLWLHILGTFWGEHIIVHIRWHLSNLKKTYLGNHRLPKFGAADVWSADVWMAGWVKHRHYSNSAHSYCQCLNVWIVPVFERALPTIIRSPFFAVWISQLYINFNTFCWNMNFSPFYEHVVCQ